MKRFSLLLFFAFFFLNGKSQIMPENPRQLDIGFGSIRNRYPYPVTDLHYLGRSIRDDFRFGARLRAYGIASLFNLRDYDLSAWAIYNYPIYQQALMYAGIGIEARLRLVNDSRSTAETSAEPFLIAGIQTTVKKFTFDFSFRPHFYSNGISLAGWPQVSFAAWKRCSFFLRFESSYLAIYKVKTHEWRYDDFFGISLKL